MNKLPRQKEDNLYESKVILLKSTMEKVAIEKYCQSFEFTFENTKCKSSKLEGEAPYNKVSV